MGVILRTTDGLKSRASLRQGRFARMRVMANHRRKPRASGAELRGRIRAADVAKRLGIGIREERLRRGLPQHAVAASAGISQSWVSLMERGRGAGATLESWAAVAAAVQEQLVGYLEHAPGASVPRDSNHLRGQELAIRTALSGGWRPLPEAPVDPGAVRSRSVDVLLVREARAEVAVVEVWDWLDDVGQAMRSFDGKLAAAPLMTHGPDMASSGIWILRGTRRNHALVAELPELFRAKFPASPREWLTALTDPATPMPREPGLLWSDVRSTRLTRVRLGT